MEEDTNCFSKPVRDTTDHRRLAMLKKIYGMSLWKLLVYFTIMVLIYCCMYIFGSSYSGSLHPDHILRHKDAVHRKVRGQDHRGPVYIIMPTYRRSNQRSLLVMQTQVLAGARGIHLILTEQATNHTEWITRLLKKSKLNFTHLTTHVHGKSCHHRLCGKGSSPRNTALQWIKETGVTNGVIYFADDDNFYDVKLFDEIKTTRTVSIFPVGGFKKTWISTPIVKNRQIVDFLDVWKAGRRWPLDMAGFAVSVQHWLKQGSPLFTHMKGYLETRFLEALNITRDTVEILASGATKIYVWHNSLGSVSCGSLTGGLRQVAAWNNTNLQQLKEYLSCL